MCPMRFMPVMQPGFLWPLNLAPVDASAADYPYEELALLVVKRGGGRVR